MSRAEHAFVDDGSEESGDDQRHAAQHGYAVVRRGDFGAGRQAGLGRLCPWLSRRRTRAQPAHVLANLPRACTR